MQKYQESFNPLPDLKLDKKRFRIKQCPCGKSNKDGKFVPYVGHEEKGYCHSCGETFLPGLPEYKQQPFESQSKHLKPIKKHRRGKPEPASFVPVEAIKKSRTEYEQNHFVTYLNSLFGREITGQLISRYCIGTSKHWNGASVFWQIDSKGRVRTGKIMLYSPNTGKRVKEPFNYITWAHSILNQPDFNLKQCFFGEHLLKGNTKPVAIVESEKTAIIASIYFPGFIWLAVGSLTNLNAERCKTLAGRQVSLFPDLNAFEKWQSKAKELLGITRFTVSDLLEQMATEAEKKQGLDLADYLIKHDWRKFRKKNTKPSPPETLPQAMPEATNCHKNKEEEKEPFQNLASVQERMFLNFTEENTAAFNEFITEENIKELEQFFAGASLPNQPIKLNPCSTITDSRAFVKAHLATIKTYKKKRASLPYLERLNQLKEHLTHSQSLN